jgi:hypothetical protein
VEEPAQGQTIAREGGGSKEGRSAELRVNSKLNAFYDGMGRLAAGAQVAEGWKVVEGSKPEAIGTVDPKDVGEEIDRSAG